MLKVRWVAFLGWRLSESKCYCEIFLPWTWGRCGLGKEVNIEFLLTCKWFIVMTVDGMGMLTGEVAVGMGRYQGPMNAGTEWAGGQSFKKKNTGLYGSILLTQVCTHDPILTGERRICPIPFWWRQYFWLEIWKQLTKNYFSPALILSFLKLMLSKYLRPIILELCQMITEHAPILIRGLAIGIRFLWQSLLIISQYPTPCFKNNVTLIFFFFFLI